MTTYQQFDSALSASGWRFDPVDEAFYDRHGILVDYGELMALVPGTTECEFAAWAEDRAEKLRAKRNAERRT